MTELIANRYQLGVLLGEGGMGMVYRALDTKTGETVAIKQLKPELVDSEPSIVERFAREAEALRQLNHPNIVKVLETVANDGLYFIVMEYVTGGSLYDLLKANRALPVEQCMSIALQLTDALTRAHFLKIIHRDIKPANVLLAEDGSPRLTDFGVAYLGTKEHVTGAGTLIGTLDYMCPESLNGDAVDVRSDIWALGIMLFEMLTGNRPFIGKNLTALVTSILFDPIPNLSELRPECPTPLIDLVNHMLEKDRSTRMPSVRLVGAKLEAIIHGGDETTHSIQKDTLTDLTRLPTHHFRIFISSPSDVADERSLALRVIDQLPHRPEFRNRVLLRPIAWDKPGAGTPMLANMTPQEAINQGLPKPSECDIVVVIFWARMGTILGNEDKKADGSRYLSGTEWEFWDAFNVAKITGRPLLVVYRRTEKIFLDDEAPDYEQHLEQKRRVKAFFDSFVNPDGSIKQGFNTYEKPDDFRQHFESHLESLILRLVEEHEVSTRQINMPNTPVETIKIWEGSPFSGLRAFTPDDAPIFFGRGHETDELVELVSRSRFVVVVGASGSGKSSLVGAGVIPRINANAISGSKDWYIVQFTPGEKPFESLAESLIKSVPSLAGEPDDYDEHKYRLAQKLGNRPSALIEICDVAFKQAPEWAEIMLFVDQFEELFTLTQEEYRIPFIEVLTYASSKLRVIATLRADFYHRCVDYPTLAEKLRSGSFPLAVPGERALYEMITRPAERAALTYEDDSLPERILLDTSNEPGNLALVAYTLDELYKLAKQRNDRQLTHNDYRALGGVQGAIGKRAESIFNDLKIDQPEVALQRVFRELVEVDERGMATRRRVPQSSFAGDQSAQDLVVAFIDARLLTASEDTGEPIVEVAHEALFTNWKTLAEWIVQAQDDLRLLRQFERDARDWDHRGRPFEMRPRNEQLKLLLTAANQLKEEITDPLLIAYTDLNTEAIVQELKEINTAHERRLFISERLGFLGDPRSGIGTKNVITVDGKEIAIPEIEWCYVSAEPLKGHSLKRQNLPIVEIKDQVFPVQPFYIAKYQITSQQFQAFLDSPEGYSNLVWWQGMPEKYWCHEVLPNQGQFPNLPRENVTWYQSVAFTKWLTAHYAGETLTSPDGIKLPTMTIGENAQIRLPTEWEWQWAAQGGFEQREYPWAGKWDSLRANSLEAPLGQTTAVGVYPDGAALCGALDMAGNVWELCLSEYDSLKVSIDSDVAHVVRGGSFHDGSHIARCAARPDHNPGNWLSGVGFRVICAAI